MRSMDTRPTLTGKHPLRVDVSETFARRLQDAAHAEHRTTASLVRHILTKALDERDRTGEDR